MSPCLVNILVSHNFRVTSIGSTVQTKRNNERQRRVFCFLALQLCSDSRAQESMVDTVHVH